MLKLKHFPHLILLCSLLISLAGCQRQAADYIGEAKKSLAKGKSDEAIVHLRNALQKEPKNAEVRFQLGVLHNEVGEYVSAEKELLKAKELGATDEAVLPALGQALVWSGQYRKALDTINPGKGFSQASLARIYAVRVNAALALGKRDEAMQSLAEAEILGPNQPEVLMAKARFSVANKKLDDALRWVDLALERDPDLAEALHVKAVLLREQKQDAAAMVLYQQILKKRPKDLESRLQLADMALAAGKIGEAEKEITAAEKINPNNLRLQYLKAVAQYRQGKYQAANNSIALVLKGEPGHAPSLLLQGSASYALGAYEQAKKNLSILVSRFPQDVNARKLLATTQLQLNEEREALETLAPLLDEKRAPPDAQSLALAGEAWMKLRDFDKATAYLSKAAAVAPENAAIKTELAISRMAGDHTEQALADLEVLAKQSTTYSKAGMVLILSRIQRKEFDAALAAVAEMEKKSPKNPLLSNMRGEAYLGKKDFNSARKSFEQALSYQANYFPASANLANLDLLDNKPDAARKRFERLLEKDNKNIQAMLELANIAAREKREAEYVSWLEKAVKAQPAAILPRTRLVDYYLKKQDPQKALGIASEAVNANPNDLVALDLLGMTQLAAGEKESAIVTLTKLASKAPGSSVAFYRLALAQQALAKSDAARASYTKALELAPDFLEAQLALAALEINTGHFGAALKLARQAQVDHHQLSAGFELEGDVLSRQKQYAQASKLFEKAYKTGKSDVLVVKLHRALTLAGETKNAEAYITQWLKENPSNVAVRLYLAQVLTHAGRNKLAIEQYEAILVKAGNEATALNNLALLYQKEKDPRALGIAERAHQLLPNDPSTMDTLGWILVERGEVSRGLTYLQKAVARAPDIPEIRYHLAAAKAKNGERVAARAELKALLDTGKNFESREQARVLLNSL